jgi:iron complex transport system substrate-binding protein
MIRTFAALLMSVLVAACAPVDPSAHVETGSAIDSNASGSASQGAPETVTVLHPQGETTVIKQPETVVVFDYSALDTLDQLGISVAAVPHATLPPHLAHYAGSTTNAGTLFEPDYEAVNLLEPDLIIVGGRSSGVYGELSSIAPTVDVTISATDFVSGFKATVQNLGVIFGREAEVVERVAAIEEAIARVNQKAAASGQTALIVMTSGGSVTAYGPGSRFGLIHDVLGVAPAVEDIEAATHGDAISFEFILEYDPDILFVVDRDSAIGQGTEAAEQIMDNELMHQTKAWKNDKLVYLDPAVWYLVNGGLGTVATMIAEVEAAFD